MASRQELQVSQKREVEKKQETTIPARLFLPTADIFETDRALTVVLEMPGVSKDNVEVNVDDGILKIDGKIDFSKYEGLRPVYTEYNIGHYTRSFQLSSAIDQNRISAEMRDGVLAVVLPKSEQAQPRRIAVS
ncbi:MAG TPA: Hsp20/alpha crystallin family protein [Hyphomicrobiaceae bacterium]|jgi:HSP20 family molecular chaperone IbpA|nr:Hsp20/alpha crystallin family protein [Hyphomicrobiaceae bacterium]